MEKSPEDPWTRVVGASLPLGRISHWFQVKGQIKSTSEDRDKEKKGPRCVPGGIPKDQKNLQPQLESRTGVLRGTLQHWLEESGAQWCPEESS